MTHWAFAVGEIVPFDARPVVLVLPVAGLATPSDPRRWRRHVLAALAAAATGMPGAGLVVGADGRRRLGGTDLFVSIAHRAGWVAAALGRKPVGVDVESDAEAADAADVILAGVDADPAAWHGLSGIWAAREAVLKAEGRDLTRDHRRWHFGVGLVHGDDSSALRVDLARLPGFVAAVAYAGG